MRLVIERKSDPVLRLSEVRRWLRSWREWAKGTGGKDMGWTAARVDGVELVLEAMLDDDDREIREA